MELNIKEIEKIQEKLNNATLVAATKYVGNEELEKLYNHNIRVFGENKVQDFLTKYETFPHKDVIWHFIGTLQSNKVKYIIDKVALIHSCDKYSLIDEINRQALKHNLVMPVLLQVNVSKEETKHGFDVEELDDVMKYILENTTNIEVKGFMTMAPHIDSEQTHIFFKKLHDLLVEYASKYPQLPLTELSMGMSNDYVEALEEGATYIRVGSKLFIR